ncbi:MAG: hypothetical protein LBO71_09165 [Prevotellaceae bacterium]|jgi:hypothetical protein|nr:hypothetical protein [Prevotellaceae bacterium]
MNVQPKILLWGMALAALSCLPSCPCVDCDYEYGSYEPIYMTRAALEASVRFVPAMPLSEPGKIYVRTTQLFICEPYKGVHVIDNSDPRNPRATDFIAIPGCVDIAVLNNILYADNAVDLVAVDLEKREEVAREQNAFDGIASPDGWWAGNSEEGTGKIIVGFTKKKRKENRY